MGQALYRNYRPKKFDDVVGQDHITQTLKNAIKSGKLSHAYLFTGPRGVGKTSVARILAHEVNKLPYTDESIHLDIIEIDAASNRRIDEIRDLRDRVRIAPAVAKYKIYIIDEVHMLTREAFNALLKTLEEPPAHCIFILATTEAHKLPETIISRTQRFEFKPVGSAQAAEHLSGIAKQEKIDIEPEALDILADYGDGSFRDSISYLDQLSSFGKKITAEDVRNLLGLPAKTEIEKLVGGIDANDSAAILEQLQAIEQHGVNPQAIAAALSSTIREKISQGNTNDRDVRILSGLLEVSASHRPKEALEICLLENVTSNSQPVQAVPPPVSAKPASPAALKISEPEIAKHVAPGAKPSPLAGSFSLDKWDEVVERSKKEAASIYTALRLAKPQLEDGKLILGFEFPLHQKKLAQTKNKDLVSQIIEEVSGAKVVIESVVDKAEVEKTPSVQPFNAISSVFGAAEVLEA